MIFIDRVPPCHPRKCGDLKYPLSSRRLHGGEISRLCLEMTIDWIPVCTGMTSRASYQLNLSPFFAFKLKEFAVLGKEAVNKDYTV